MSPPRWSGSKTKSEIKRERRESFRTNVFSPPPMAVPPGVAQIMVCVSAAGQIQQSAGGVIVRNRIERRLCFAIRSFVRAAVSCYGGINFGFRRVHSRRLRSLRSESLLRSAQQMFLCRSPRGEFCEPSQGGASARTAEAGFAILIFAHRANRTTVPASRPHSPGPARIEDTPTPTPANNYAVSCSSQSAAEPRTIQNAQPTIKRG